MRFATGIVLAGFVLASALSHPTHHHKELAIVWPLFFTAIILSMMFALCQTPSTAPWNWQIVNSVVSGLLAMQWCNILSGLQPNEDDAFGRLMFWIGMYLAVAGFLYILAVSGIQFAAPPREALAWFVSTAAGGFCSAVLPDEFIGHSEGVAILFAEPLIFYFIWMIPRTMEMGLKAWNIQSVQLGVPGTSGRADDDDKIHSWRADCDGICWGAAPFAMAGNGLRILKTCVTGDPYCHNNDRCSWDANGHFWLGATGALLLVTLVCAMPLARMKDSRGFSNIVGSTVLSSLTTSVAMGVLNTLRHEVSTLLCSQFDLCDKNHDVFLYLMVAYAATIVAMIMSMVMAFTFEMMHEESHCLIILQYFQNSVSLQAGLAWYSVFDRAQGSGALDVLGVEGPKLALLLTATILPLYCHFVRPANCKVQDLAKAARAAKKQD